MSTIATSTPSQNMQNANGVNMFFVKIAILYLQNHCFWLWWVDVSHIIAIFVKKHIKIIKFEKSNSVYTESLLLAVVGRCITYNCYEISPTINW